jgi:small subunit ribosomal protein S2e
LAQEKEWQPVTKLGRLVKAGKIKSMEEMYVHGDCENNALQD